MKGAVDGMCVSCGCGQMNEDHGDKRSITMKGLEQAAKAAGSSVQEVAKNIQKSASQVAQSH